MKLIAFGSLLVLLAVPASALAFSPDATVAAKQACIQVNDARALIFKSRDGCKVTPVKVWFNVCKGSIVVVGSQPLPEDTIFPDTICPSDVRAISRVTQKTVVGVLMLAALIVIAVICFAFKRRGPLEEGVEKGGVNRAPKTDRPPGTPGPTSSGAFDER